MKEKRKFLWNKIENMYKNMKRKIEDDLKKKYKKT